MRDNPVPESFLWVWGVCLEPHSLFFHPYKKLELVSVHDLCFRGVGGWLLEVGWGGIGHSLASAIALSTYSKVSLSVLPLGCSTPLSRHSWQVIRAFAYPGMSRFVVFSFPIALWQVSHSRVTLTIM